jgi:hypothetical protein
LRTALEKVGKRLGPAIEASTRAVVFSQCKEAAWELAGHFCRKGIESVAFDLGVVTAGTRQRWQSIQRMGRGDAKAASHAAKQERFT